MRPLTLSLALLFGLSGCSLLGGTSTGDPDLDDARARWADADFEDYRMTLVRSCFCPEDYRGPFEVAVEGGRVQTVVFSGDALPPDRALTVEALFDLLAEAYREGAARIDVTYHPTLGYPTSLYIDRSEQIADEEIGYTVTDLRAD